MPPLIALLVAVVHICAVSSGESFYLRHSNGSAVTKEQIRFSSGATVVLDCALNVTSKNGTTVAAESLVWTRNGSAVEESSLTTVPVRQSFVNGTQRLYISPFTNERQGVYTCVRNVSNMTALAFAMLDVFILLDQDVCSQCHPNATCEFGNLGIPRCRCNNQFYGNGTFCERDFCISGLNDCDPYATCENLLPSFECTCMDPYTGDGTHCEGDFPSFVRDPEESIILAGDTIRLQCVVNGVPPSKITWWKDGVDVSQGVQPKPVLPFVADRMFVIMNATMSDSGSYVCVSKTNFSSRQPDLTITSTFNVTVQAPARVHLEVTLPQGASSPVLLLEGSKFAVGCSYAGVPVPVVIWSYKSQQLMSGVNVNGIFIIDVSLKPIALLDINRVALHHAGQYTCTGTNNVTRLGVQTSRSSVQLMVEGIANISTNPMDAHVPVNGSALFTCQASGYPLPTFRWFYNDIEVLNGQKFAIETVELQSNLTVYDVQLSDNGTVVCVVNNSVTLTTPTEVRSSPAYLIPEVPAHILLLPSVSLSAALNSSTTVRCLYRGTPKPVVRWYHYETKLPSNDRHRINTAAGQSILMIHNVNENDAGVYRCSVSNENSAVFGGSDSVNITLDVYNSLDFVTCQPYNGTVCKDFILGDAIFYNLKDTNFEKSELLMMKVKAIFDRFLLSKNCFDFAFPLVCHFVFPPCRVNVSIPTRRQICKGDCLTASTELCPTLWNAIQDSITALDLGHLRAPSCVDLPYMNGGDEQECVGISDVLPPGDRENTEMTDNCVIGKGRGYKGVVNVTKSGRACQHWNVQSPHAHSLLPKDYPLELTDAQNYCRNPGGRAADGPWCYTNDTSVRWEYCNIPKCNPEYSCQPYQGTICRGLIWTNDPVFVNATLGTQAMLEKSVMALNSTFSDCWTSFLPLVCGLAFPPCDKSTDIVRPRHVCRQYCEYVRDKKCSQQWNDNFVKLAPLLNIDPLPVPDCDLLPSVNGGESPLCLIGNSDYTAPNLTVSNLTSDCYDDATNGQTYRGKVSMTRTGLECQDWKAHYPQYHSLTEFVDFKALGINIENNFCRNPERRGDRPWCLTADPNTRWEYCSVPRCGGELIPVSITHSPRKSLEVNVGDNITLECEADGRPEPTIQWLHPLNETGRVVIESPRRGYSRLTVVRAVIADGGVYTCIASNEAKSVTAISNVEVIDPTAGYVCAPYNGSVCQNELNSNMVFYDLRRTNFMTSEALMGNLRLVFLETHTSQNCYDFSYHMLCNYVFPPCRVAVPPTPRPICKEDCITGSLQLCLSVWDAILRVIDLVPSNHLGKPSCDPLQYQNGGDVLECIGRSDLLPPADRMNTIKTDKCIYGRGRGYVGKQNFTKSGHTCQQWDVQQPHPHSLLPSIYPLELDDANNYCRNPGGRGPDGVWCYTTNPFVRWEYCDIPRCEEERSCEMYTGELCKPLVGNSTVFVDTSIGNQASLENGLRNFVTAFEQQDIAAQCRASILELACGTGLPVCDVSTDIRRPLPICREYCEYVLNEMCQTEFEAIRKVLPVIHIAPLQVPNCSVLPSIMHGGDTPTCRTFGSRFRAPNLGTRENVTYDCYVGDGQSYRGKVVRTKSGRHCQAWLSRYPHNHTLDHDTDFGALGVTDVEDTYCRNPQGRADRPWCYTTDPNVRWESCNVTECEKVMENSSSSGTDVTLVVGAAVGGSVVVLVLIIICGIIISKRHSKRNGSAGFDDLVIGNRSTSRRRSQIRSNPHYHPLPLDEDLLKLEYPVEDLEYLEHLGEGYFGKVFKGKARKIISDQEETIVAVKTLKEGASEASRKDFERECKLLSEFQNDNIVRLLAVCMAAEPQCMIFEFMSQGDLNEFLRSRSPHDMAVTVKKALAEGETPPDSLTQSNLVDICRQIAAGMSYLSQRHYVHRDLATRNCLVDDGLVVKIADFGMSQDLYSSDYYRVGENAMLPVRWMPPEAIIYGKFTVESDVWSYGVVMWETFSYAMQPYFGLSNEEVVDRVRHGSVLEKPDNCPDDVYDLMKRCWTKEPFNRPAFAVLECQLSRALKGEKLSVPETPSHSYQNLRALQQYASETSLQKQAVNPTYDRPRLSFDSSSGTPERHRSSALASLVIPPAPLTEEDIPPPPPEDDAALPPPSPIDAPFSLPSQNGSSLYDRPRLSKQADVNEFDHASANGAVTNDGVSMKTLSIDKQPESHYVRPRVPLSSPDSRSETVV